MVDILSMWCELDVLAYDGITLSNLQKIELLCSSVDRNV